MAPDSQDVNDGSNLPKTIVNDLLCYINNKRDLIPSDTIIKLCMDTYDEKEIEIAKNEIFETYNIITGMLPTSRQKIRKGENKNKSNLEDILKIFADIDNNNLKDSFMFLARDLKLPPLNFDSLDVTLLLNRVQSLHDEVAIMKTTATVQQDTNEELLKELKVIRSEFSAQITKLNSKVSNLEPHNSKEKQKNKVDTTNKHKKTEGKSNSQNNTNKTGQTNATNGGQNTPEHPIDSSESTANHNTDLLYPNLNEFRTSSTPVTDTVPQEQSDEDLSENTENTEEKSNANPWVNIVKNGKKKPDRAIQRKKPNMVTSSDPTDVGFAAHRLAIVYATKFRPDITEDEVSALVLKNTNIKAQCTKVQSKHPDFYSSFIVKAACLDPDIFMKPTSWPTGIFYNWYRKPAPETQRTNHG